jgi:hypothetical protein
MLADMRLPVSSTVAKRPQVGETIASGFRIRTHKLSLSTMTNVLPFPSKQDQGLWEPQKRLPKALKSQKMRKPPSQLRARQIVLQCRNLFLAALFGGLVMQYVMNSWLPNSHGFQQIAPLTSDEAGKEQRRNNQP